MNLVSLSLFGDVERYVPYLPAAIRAHHNLYRGWHLRIHHDGSAYNCSYGAALRKLEERSLVELWFMGASPLIEKGMLWRLAPLFDDNVERFLTRDVDTVPGFRERRAVETWIRSGLPVHAMSDYAKHHDFPTLGGMMGFVVPEARRLIGANTLDELLDRAGWSDEVWNAHHRAGDATDEQLRVSIESSNDQTFLKRFVWPHVKHRTLEHRLSGSCTFPGTAKTFRVVEPFTEDDLGVSFGIRNWSDELVPFIGASNIDLDAAITFYKEHGHPTTERLISECEET